MKWSPLIITMATLLLVVSVACGAESKATPSPTATLAPSPTSSPTLTPELVAVGEGNGLTPEQEACLVDAIGERAVREAKTRQRRPTSDEVDALIGCGIMEPKPDFDLLPEAFSVYRIARYCAPRSL